MFDVSDCLQYISSLKRAAESKLSDNERVNLEFTVSDLQKKASPSQKSLGDRQAQYALSVIYTAVGYRDLANMYFKKAARQHLKVPLVIRQWNDTELRKGHLNAHNKEDKVLAKRISLLDKAGDELKYRQPRKPTNGCCPSCGKRLGDTSYCPECGQKILKE